MKPEDILTTDGLAERLQVKRSSVYEKCRRRASHSGAATPCLNLRRYLPFYGRTSANGCAMEKSIEKIH